MASASAPSWEPRLDRFSQDSAGLNAYRSIAGDARTGFLILCDHAENAIPPAFDRLGLKEQDLHRHIAYDLGAAAVAERLAEHLGAPAILSSFSRLLIDPNRGLDDPTLVMQLSDGLIVPGNTGLDAEALRFRIESFYKPYHLAVAGAVDAAIARGSPPVIVSIHSFTQAWKGVHRPWAVGVLWDKDPRLAVPLLRALRAIPGIEVGDNLPYSGQLKGDTLYQHGTSRGLAHALIELRQDLILGAEGQAEWAKRLATALRKVLDEAGGALNAIELHGSRTDGTGDRRGAAGKAGQAIMNEKTQTEIEAEAFRRLVRHLRERTDVQNIDLMELAGFCRNCLANWYQEAAGAKGLAVSKDEAREAVYGMAYEEWKARYQTEAPKPLRRSR